MENKSNERRDEASSQNLQKNSEAANGLPQSTGSEFFVNAWGQPIVKNGDSIMIDYHVSNAHPILLYILRLIMKRVGKTGRRSHLKRT